MRTKDITIFEAYNQINEVAREEIDKHLKEIESKKTLDECQIDWLYMTAIESFIFASMKLLCEMCKAQKTMCIEDNTYRDIGLFAVITIDDVLSETIDTLKGQKPDEFYQERASTYSTIISIINIMFSGKMSFQEMSALFKSLKNDNEKTIIDTFKGLERKYEKPKLMSGKGYEELTQLVAQSSRSKGFDVDNLSLFNQTNKKTSLSSNMVGGECEVTVRIQNTQDKTLSILSCPSKFLPKSKHTPDVVMWIARKLAKEGYSLKSKTLKTVGVNINDLVGEDNIFAEKRQALEPFREARELFKNFEWVGVYTSVSQRGRVAQISTFGEVKKDRNAILPERIFNIGYFNDTSEDEAFFIEGIEGVKYETFMHKIVTAPRAFFFAYSTVERELVYHLLCEWDKGGTPKSGFKVLSYEKILDGIGFAINNPTRPKRVIDEVVKTVRSINERDGGETFNRLEVKFDDTVKQPKKRLKTMRIFYSVNRCEECLEIEHKKGVDNGAKI